MSRNYGIAATLALLTALVSASAGAQDPATDPQWSDDPWNNAAKEEGQTTPPPATSELPEEGVKTKFNWAMTIGVPIWLDVPLSVVRPGADLSWVGGVDIGYAVFGFGIGVMWTPIDLRNFTDDNGQTGGQSPVTRLYFFPEVRLQVPNDSVVLPYISGAFDVNWWNFRETGLTCGFWFCNRSSVYRFTPGFTGQVGLAFEIKRGVKFDLGMKYSFTGKGDFFVESRWWLTPYVWSARPPEDPLDAEALIVGLEGLSDLFVREAEVFDGVLVLALLRRRLLVDPLLEESRRLVGVLEIEVRVDVA